MTDCVFFSIIFQSSLWHVARMASCFLFYSQFRTVRSSCAVTCFLSNNFFWLLLALLWGHHWLLSMDPYSSSYSLLYLISSAAPASHYHQMPFPQPEPQPVSGGILINHCINWNYPFQLQGLGITADQQSVALHHMLPQVIFRLHSTANRRLGNSIFYPYFFLSRLDIFHVNTLICAIPLSKITCSILLCTNKIRNIPPLMIGFIFVWIRNGSLTQ